MRLLVCTQMMNRPDPALGFFVAWVRELALRTEHVDVICLYEGAHELPPNVRVLSLGKEHGRASRPQYAMRFWRHLRALRGNYDAVFVHQNQEYLFLGGSYWRMRGKRVYMWRNHYEGTWLTDVAAALCTKVFCTSRYSYTAKYKKTVIMPVGVDIESTHPEIPVERIPRSILFLARLDSSKRPELLLDALSILAKKGVPFTASFVGGPTDANSTYPDELKRLAQKLGVAEFVNFTGSIPNTETFRQYRSHEIFVNCSKSGMLDKTTFKAMASGCLVLSSSADLAREMGEEFVYQDGDARDLAEGLAQLLSLPPRDADRAAQNFQSLVERNSLPHLADRLIGEMQ